MRVAYLINQYPKVSHSFIRREINALEQQGIEVMRIALRGWESDVVDDADKVEIARTCYVLRKGALALVFPVLRALATQPLMFLKSMVLAYRMSRGADRPLPFHFAYLAEACQVAVWVKSAGVHHVHAHFGTNPAEIAMLVHSLGGPSWSFTAHGTETFDNPKTIGITEKLKRCAFVAAVSYYGRAQLYRYIDHKHWQKVHVIRCGLDATYKNHASLISPFLTRFVCVARLSEEKGHLILLEAVRRLAAQNISFELVLAGDGDLRNVIEAIIERDKLQGHVRVTGWINGRQVVDELIAARALILPSFAEGLPVVIMEAMALRRPVISTLVGAIPELVSHGEHGWLVPPGNVEALVNAMRECLEMAPDALSRMGDCARQRVLPHHDVENETSKLAKLFSEESLAQQEANTSNGAL